MIECIVLIIAIGSRLAISTRAWFLITSLDTNLSDESKLRRPTPCER
jgi:hypothetical protein